MPIETSAFGIGRFAIIKNFPLCRGFPSQARLLEPCRSKGGPWLHQKGDDVMVREVDFSPFARCTAEDVRLALPRPEASRKMLVAATPPAIAKPLRPDGKARWRRMCKGIRI